MLTIDQLTIDQLVDPITSILYKSLAEGTFPDLLKLASVCPIYKKNYRTKCANYRPISLLSNLSKILKEQCITESNFSSPNLIHYIDFNLALGKILYGTRPFKHSRRNQK